MIRALIIDDQLLFAEAIRSTLLELGMEVVGVVGTGREGVDTARRTRPDLVLIDLLLPDGHGISVGREIRAELRAASMVAVTASEDRRSVEEAMVAGFNGYIRKDVSVSGFRAAIAAVLDGQVVTPPWRGRASSDGHDENVAMLARTLTRRELEVLALLVEGMNGRAIAGTLGISANTVRTHVQSILAKLQVHSRLEAATTAVRHGIVVLNDREISA